MNGIIIIDDNARLARSAAEFLGNEEFGPIEVCVDLAAADSASVRIPLPSAIIADIQLPGIPPRHAVERMKRLWPHSPVIGWSAAEVKPETRSLLDAFVHKAQACQELPRLLRTIRRNGQLRTQAAESTSTALPRPLDCPEDLRELHTLVHKRDAAAAQSACHRLLGAAQWTGDLELEIFLKNVRETVSRSDWQGALSALDARICRPLSAA